jgi:hypothetical protein
MVGISPPVQEALSALERLQADAYRRGWQDAMDAVAGFAASSKTGQGKLDTVATHLEPDQAKPRRPRGPNRDSLPSRILDLLNAGPVHHAELPVRAQEAIPDESLANIKRAINRLLARGQILPKGSDFVSYASVVSAADQAARDRANAETPEAPATPEHSGLFNVSKDQEQDAAA